MSEEKLEMGLRRVSSPSPLLQPELTEQVEGSDLGCDLLQGL